MEVCKFTSNRKRNPVISMNKKHIALNTHLFFFAAFFLAVLGIFESCVREGKIGLSIGLGLFLLAPVFCFFISPLYFVFSDEGVEIVYHFGQREYIKWNEIRDISLMGSWLSRGSGPPHYVITYPRKERRPFFVAGEISKTGKTKKLLKKYYQKKIH